MSDVVLRKLMTINFVLFSMATQLQITGLCRPFTVIFSPSFRTSRQDTEKNLKICTRLCRKRCSQIVVNASTRYSRGEYILKDGLDNLHTVFPHIMPTECIY